MPSNSTTRTAVVVGATGIVGRAIAAKLAELGGWRVVGVNPVRRDRPRRSTRRSRSTLLDPAEARPPPRAPARGATHGA